MTKGYQCPLGKFQQTPMNTEKVKADGWRNDGILVVQIDDARLNWVDRQFVLNLGEKLYGRRK